MTGTVLIGYVMVPLAGVLLCAVPVMSRPTLQFGVRVPPAYTTAAVIRRERRGYLWRSAVVAVCAVLVLIVVGGRTSGWQNRVVLVAEFLADLGCYWWAHQRITKVKAAEGWFAGRRQTVVADTSWRTEPQRFPVRWLLPAVVVIAATVVIGVLRYPHLPAYLPAAPLRAGGRLVATSPVSAFGLVIAQVYVTGLWTALLALVHRARPDLDAADPAASLRAHRAALAAFARAGLILLACLDLTLLLAGLQRWQVVGLSGGWTALALLPFVLGLVAFLLTAVRAGRLRARVVAGNRAGTADRDDDRFWKGGLIYVNRDDPAVLVTARFGYGWTVNFGNPTAWLLVAGFFALPVGLVILRFTTGI